MAQKIPHKTTVIRDGASGSLTLDSLNIKPFDAVNVTAIQTIYSDVFDMQDLAQASGHLIVTESGSGVRTLDVTIEGSGKNDAADVDWILLALFAQLAAAGRELKTFTNFPRYIRAKRVTAGAGVHNWTVSLFVDAKK